MNLLSGHIYEPACRVDISPLGKMKGGHEYKKRYILFTTEIHKNKPGIQRKKNKQ
jgi:hypothetical protein